MVELVIPRQYGSSDLELELVKNNIEYQLCLDVGQYGLTPPHLVVNGVPLDYKRSLAWLEEYKNGC